MQSEGCGFDPRVGLYSRSLQLSWFRRMIFFLRRIFWWLWVGMGVSGRGDFLGLACRVAVPMRGTPVTMRVPCVWESSEGRHVLCATIFMLFLASACHGDG